MARTPEQILADAQTKAAEKKRKKNLALAIQDLEKYMEMHGDVLHHSAERREQAAELANRVAELGG
ncbi:hypothetical protein [Frankia sp. BMG5.23]|uniref:hypothetical protein n=1 Tax=Frankia sp. BMG5.23 TaxID=683305 RepID=UPI000461C1EF|nr:hypothetical protein [Frankia sp. BMG5.23]KDA44961.1 hypothetical protein BMG523Draft_00086 [Frankia sp. BMG5.23]